MLRSLLKIKRSGLISFDLIAIKSNIANMQTEHDLYSLDTSQKLPSAPASILKNAFKNVFETMSRSGPISITRNRRREAILLPADLYDRMVKEIESKDPLKLLHTEFEARFSKMQNSVAQQAYVEAFNATPEELGQAAVANASEENVA